MRIRGICASVAALSMIAAAPAAAAAQGKAAKPNAASAAGAAKGGGRRDAMPDFGAMMRLMDKLFPPQAEPDASRLALARTSVQTMWPDGAYGKMMTGFMGGMMDRAMQLKTSDFAHLGGKTDKAGVAAVKGDLSLHDQIAGKDPYFDRRMAAMRDVVGEELGKVSMIIDPRMREGLARAMARRFDAHQLDDINRFFATPSGQAFAGQYMQLWFDPDTIRSIFASMPEMMKLMPEMMQKFKAANDQFPKAPSSTPAASKH
jgi:hypothetical protein